MHSQAECTTSGRTYDASETYPLTSFRVVSGEGATEVSLIPDRDLARGKHIILQNQLKYHDSHQIFGCFALLRGAYCRRWHPKGP